MSVKKHIEDLEFSFKVRSGDEVIDKIEGDWKKFEDGVRNWEDKLFGRRKKK